MKETKDRGITLIALIVTIIILLILAGVAISSLTGSGLFVTAEEAKEKTIKAQLQEEIEMAIQEIQIEELPKGNSVTLESLANGQLVAKLTEITSDLGTDEITGEYKDYDYTITREYKVIIGNKLVGEKPTITHTVDTEEIGVTQVVITVNASVSDGTIVEIVKPDGSTEENVEQVTYTVNKSGKYTFTAKSSNGRKTSCTVNITNILPTAPVIESEGGYPILTSTGMIEDDGLITITYDTNDNLENTYSEDEGVTWKTYTQPFKTEAVTIKARSTFKNMTDISSETEKRVIPTDTIEKNAYDGDESTAQFIANSSKICAISEDAVGETLYIHFSPSSLQYGMEGYIEFLGEDKSVIQSEMSVYEYSGTVVIPEGSKYLRMRFNQLYGLYEIKLLTMDFSNPINLTGKEIDESKIEYIYNKGIANEAFGGVGVIADPESNSIAEFRSNYIFCATSSRCSANNAKIGTKNAIDLSKYESINAVVNCLSYKEGNFGTAVFSADNVNTYLGNYINVKEYSSFESNKSYIISTPINQTGQGYAGIHYTYDKFFVSQIYLIKK